MSNKKKKV